MTWVTATKGIVYREHEKRKHGRIKDRYYALTYRLNGKKIFESLGWASDGIDIEQIEKDALQLALNRKVGTPPFSYKELKHAEYEKKETEKAEEQRLFEQSERENASLQTLESFYFDVYEPRLKESNKAQRQILNEQGHFKNWIANIIGNRPLKNVEKDDVERVIKNLVKKSKSAQTQRHVLNCLSMVLELAREHGLFTGDNPCKSIKLAKVDNARTRFLTKDEANALLAELKRRSFDTHDIALLSLFTGLRAGEIQKLVWADIRDDIIDVKDAKNGESRAAFVMDKKVKTMLEVRRGNVPNAPCDKVFPSGLGGASGKSPQISDAFDRAVVALGFNNGITDRRQRVVFHTLRHTYASWLVGQGVPLYDVSGLMGHKTPKMTQRYAKHDPAGLKKRAQTLAGILD